MNKEIRNIINTPTVSYWLKESIMTALQRDIVDASYDAALLAKVLGDYRDQQLRKKSWKCDLQDGNLLRRHRVLK